MTTKTPAAVSTGNGPQEALFTRKSSGLVREVGGVDTMLFGVQAVAIPYVVFMILAWPLYGGASMGLATVATIVGSGAVGITYYLLTTAYPRSGGEYVFVSRILHPTLGFMVSLSMVFFQSLYIGVNGAFLAKYGLAPTFQGLAVQEHSSKLASLGTWFGSNWGLFIVGTALVVLFGVAHCYGPRLFFRIQRWCFVIGLVSLAVTLVVFALGAAGALDFRTAFNAVAGPGAYRGVIQHGRASGVSLTPGFSLRDTANFMVWPAFSVLFAVLTVEFGGEVRNVRRSQLIGIPGAMILGGLLIAAIAVLSQAAVGTEFLRASALDTKYPIAAPAFVNVDSFWLGGSVVLSIVMSLWVLALIPITVGGGQLQTSRGVLAWSLDGILPRAFGKVPNRTHAPVIAVITVSIIGEIFLALFAFTTSIAILSGLLGFTFVFVVVMIAGALFPVLKKDVFQGSGAAVRIAGIPVIVLTSLVGLAFIGFLAYRACVDNVFAANTHISIVMTVAVIVAGAVWYYAARSLQRRRGTDIERRFAEIPIE